MSRISMSFAAIILLVNLILSSSATPIHDVTKLGEKTIQLDESNIVSLIEMKRLDRAAAFVGDLTIGQRRPGERIYQDQFEIRNPTNNLTTTQFSFSVQNGIIHYASITNELGSYAAVCDLPHSLGTSKSYFSARVVPNSISKLRIIVAAH